MCAGEKRGPRRSSAGHSFEGMFSFCVFVCVLLPALSSGSLLEFRSWRLWTTAVHMRHVYILVPWLLLVSRSNT